MRGCAPTSSNICQKTPWSRLGLPQGDAKCMFQWQFLIQLSRYRRLQLGRLIHLVQVPTLTIKAELVGLSSKCRRTLPANLELLVTQLR
eukprot:949359-Pelagomonas_calceolata.AAC.7